MFRFWGNTDPSHPHHPNMPFTAVEEELSEEELRIIERGGARLCSSHHRPQASTVSSATSSAASVATSAGSTAALIRSKRPRPLWRMGPGNQRERNLLLTAPKLPEIMPKPKELEMVSCVEPRKEKEQSTIITVGDYRDTSYLPQVLAAISVSLGSMIAGFVSAYTSPAIPSLETDPQGIGDISDLETSWISSLMPLFAIFGGIMGGPGIDRLGRRTTILLTSVPFLISFLLIALATNVTMIYTGRSLAGLCIGIVTLAMPVYLGETIQSEVRGVLGLLPTTVGNLGILISFSAGAYLDWRQLAFVGAGIPVPFIICMFLIPETPRWYVSKGKKKQARKALQWLRGQYADVSTEFNEIEKSQESQLSESSVGFMELFSARYRKPLLISMGLMLFQQLSGINAVMFYMKDIFKKSKGTIDENLCSIIIGLVNLVTVFVSSALIDRLGRKILLYVSSILMAITITLLGIYFYFKEFLKDVNIEHLGWIPLVSIILYTVGFSIGFGPIPWLMMGEILPARIRGSAASIATSFNWFTTFIITKSFVVFGHKVGYSYPFLIYGALCLVSLVFVSLCVPETQGKSLEDIERNLTGSGPKIPVRTARRMSSIANLKPTPVAI